jgi:hypothetical protein
VHVAEAKIVPCGRFCLVSTAQISGCRSGSIVYRNLCTMLYLTFDGGDEIMNDNDGGYLDCWKQIVPRYSLLIFDDSEKSANFSNLSYSFMTC